MGLLIHDVGQVLQPAECDGELIKAHIHEDNYMEKETLTLRRLYEFWLAFSAGRRS